jgi:hypothetical protein
MFTNDTIQDSISSIESNDTEIYLSPPWSNTTQCESFPIDRSRRTALTIADGRRSKDLVLVGAEAVRREKQRERNRKAARKSKEKRQLIEEELHQKVKYLEDQHIVLQGHVKYLEQRQQLLQDKINYLQMDPIEELLSNNNHNMPLFFEQYSNDLDLFDESIGQMLNFDFNTNFHYPFAF